METYFKDRLKSVLKDNALNRPERHQRTGVLDTKSLWKARSTDRIFVKRQSAVKGKVYSICLMVDASGSMHWDGKAPQTLNAIHKILPTLSALANVGVFGFNCELSTIRQFPGSVVPMEEGLGEINEQLKELDRCMNQRSSNDRFGGNHDDHTFAIARDLLLKQPGDKLMIVLSDGKPSCDHCKYGHCKYEGHYNNNDDQRADKFGRLIEGFPFPVCAVGIIDSTVKNYYKNYRVINSADKVYEAILDLLNGAIKRKITL